MLVQLPQQPQEERRVRRSEPERSAFEAALSRDIASIRVIAYGPLIGGLGKRIGDLAFVLLTAPIWAPALLVALVSAKARRSSGAHRAISADECVGYGGVRFKRWRLNLKPPSAEIVPINRSPQDNSARPEPQDEKPPITWFDVIERLPEMINILKGEMSLVGPRPVSPEAFTVLRGGGKYYACCRPGVVSASDCGPSDDPEALLCKYYAMRWTPALDVRIILLALKRFSPMRGARRQDLPPEAT